MLNVLEKHKLIGGSGGSNTLTYLETSDADFEVGELYNVVSENGSLTLMKKPSTSFYLDGTDFIDKSPNRLDITKGGSVAIANVEDEGSVMSFNGSSLGYVDIPNGKLLLTQNYTIETRLKIKGATSDYHILLHQGTSSNDIRLCIDPNRTKFSLDWWNGNSTNQGGGISFKQPLDINTWYDLKIVFNSSVKKVKLYVNEVLQGILSFTNLPTAKSGVLRLGANASSGGYSNYDMKYFKFYTEDLDEFNVPEEGYRISPTITRPTKFKNAKVNWEGEGKISLYKCTHNEGIDDNTVLLIRDDFKDISRYNKEVTSTNATISDEGKFTNSIKFDSNSSIKISEGFEGIDLSKDFTIDWWEYSTGTSTGSCGILTNRSNVTSNYARGLLIGYAGTKIYAGTSSATTSWNIFNAVTFKDKVDNEWVHWALVKKDSEWTSYKNGVKFWSVTNSNTVGQTDGDNMTLGAWVDNDSIDTGYNALICEFRMSNIARWTKDFTPPTRPYVEDDMFNLPLKKNETIISVPQNFQLREEVKDDETISNVSLEMKSELGNFYMYPGEEDDNILYLYNLGDECIDITEGWGNYVINTTYATESFSKEDTRLKMYIDNSTSAMGGSSRHYNLTPVDISKYSKVKGEVEIVNNRYRAMNIKLEVMEKFNDENSKVAEQVISNAYTTTGSLDNGVYNFEIDISNISGRYYICPQLGLANGASTMYTYKIWLEK